MLEELDVEQVHRNQDRYVVTLGHPTEYDDGRAYITLEWYDDERGTVLVCWFHRAEIELRSVDPAPCSCLRDVIRTRRAAFGTDYKES